MTETVKAAPKTQPNTDKVQAAPKTEQKEKTQTGRPYIFDQPGPMFRPKAPSSDWISRYFIKTSMAVAKLLMLAAALSTFARKETQAENGESALTAGCLGVTLMKTSIQNGNPKTDFNGKMIFTETANEIVKKIAPQISSEPFFKSEPIKNGAFNKLISEKNQTRE